MGRRFEPLPIATSLWGGFGEAETYHLVAATAYRASEWLFGDAQANRNPNT